MNLGRKHTLQQTYIRSTLRGLNYGSREQPADLDGVGRRVRAYIQGPCRERIAGSANWAIVSLPDPVGMFLVLTLESGGHRLHRRKTLLNPRIRVYDIQPNPGCLAQVFDPLHSSQ